ncbi:MAG: pantoate--beta-alanine ligase [Myxococcota bacterium]
MSRPEIISDPAALHAWASKHGDAGARIVLVPTMGALHEGHLSLVREARRHGDAVVVSIFVNPTQFGPNEDLDNYPRDLEADIEQLASVDVQVIFTPTPKTVYRPGFDTYVVPQSMGSVLCGVSRPNHFRGVCTVVLLLFRMSRCHVAVFGEKDFQQLQIMRRMTRDLWLDVDIVGAPIVREPDGLAMSSRNAYLSETERRDALALSRALERIADLFAAGERHAAVLLKSVHQTLAEAASARIEYAEIVDTETLQPLARVEQSAVCALAVFVGATRLIDNRRLTAT